MTHEFSKSTDAAIFNSSICRSNSEQNSANELSILEPELGAITLAQVPTAWGESAHARNLLKNH